MDAFSPPETDEGPHATGHIDMGHALSEGLAAFLRNLAPLLGASLLGVAAYTASFCTCVGWILVVPLLVWGLYALMLQAVDGRAEVATLFRPFRENLGDAWWRSGLLLLIMFLLYLPGLGANMAAGMANGLTPDLHPMVPTLAAQGLTFLWTLALARLSLAYFVMVDTDSAPIDALATSWTETSGQWMALIGILLVGFILKTPFLVGTAWMSTAMNQVPPHQVFDVMLPMLGGVMVVSLLSGVIDLWIYLSLGAGYRQLFGAVEPSQSLG